MVKKDKIKLIVAIVLVLVVGGSVILLNTRDTSEFKENNENQSDENNITNEPETSTTATITCILGTQESSYLTYSNVYYFNYEERTSKLLNIVQEESIEANTANYSETQKEAVNDMLLDFYNERLIEINQVNEDNSDVNGVYADIEYDRNNYIVKTLFTRDFEKMERNVIENYLTGSGLSTYIDENLTLNKDGFISSMNNDGAYCY